MEGVLAGREEIFFGDALIDDVAQALRPRFRGKGQAALTDLLDFLGDIDGKLSTRSDGRLTLTFCPLSVEELIDQFRQAGIVRRAQLMREISSYPELATMSLASFTNCSGVFSRMGR